MVRPVSYTHLDVYKRQSLSLKAGPLGEAMTLAITSPFQWAGMQLIIMAASIASVSYMAARRARKMWD